MQTYLLVGKFDYDGGTESDWSQPFQEEIPASTAAESLDKAREIVSDKLKKAGNFEGFSASLFGPLVKRFRYQKEEPARPAVKARKKVKAGLVEV